MILDTSFLIDVLRGDDSVQGRLDTIDESGPPRVSAISVMELWEGIQLADSTAAERAGVRDLLEELHELPFDRECAIEAGTVNAELLDAGERVDLADVQIAATARVHELPVVTANADHFERVDGIRVLDY
jgi:tRNA(fMet)-specific endonuclease VapC